MVGRFVLQQVKQQLATRVPTSGGWHILCLSEKKFTCQITCVPKLLLLGIRPDIVSLSGQPTCSPSGHHGYSGYARVFGNIAAAHEGQSADLRCRTQRGRLATDSRLAGCEGSDADRPSNVSLPAFPPPWYKGQYFPAWHRPWTLPAPEPSHRSRK